MIQKYKIFLSVKAILIALFIANSLFAQEDESATKGTEFWLTFLPNYHNSVSDNSLYNTDSLYILIAAEEATTGKIEYKNYLGQEFERNFTISNSDEIYSFRVLWNDFELRGLNNSKEILTNSQNEKIAKQSFKITTDKGVNVYAHSQAVTTSEAATIYPVSALDTSYYVMSYNSDGSQDNWTEELYYSSTPSQYAIVAPYDNTNITINNITRTWNNWNTTQNITLNSGDVYLVQADMTENVKADLTGSKIESSKPVAVFGGQQRAKVPPDNGASRDLLYEQIPSVQSLGREYFITPFFQPSSINSLNNDVYRILALEDSTVVKFSNDSKLLRLNEGEFNEKRLIEPHKITANKKIIVAVYKKTSQSGQLSADSDPFMLILPPVEKFSNKYRFLNIQVIDPEQTWDNVYKFQYVTIVTDNRNLTQKHLEIDGVNVSELNFTNIDSSGYSYRNVNIGDGNHTIEGVYNFTVLVYGYGYANSYAYFAGMNYKGDQINPKFQSDIDCFNLEGTVTDSTYLDKGLGVVQVVEEESYNTNTVFSDYDIPAPVVEFQTKLINEYEDGVVSINATDVSGLTSKLKYDIKGFTVAVEGYDDYTNGQEPFNFYDSTGQKNKHCMDFVLYNYGKFDQTITNIELTNTTYFIYNLDLPVTIKSGESQTLEICFVGGDYDIYETDLIIEGDCADRYAAYLNLVVAGDETPPEVYTYPDECNEVIDISITDTTIFDAGIKEVRVIETENCEIRVSSESVHIFNLQAYVLNTREDAYFKIEVADSSDNIKEYEEFIQGFTLDFVASNDDNNSEDYDIDFGDQVVGDLVCDTISITNYGDQPFEIDKPWFFEHIYFSTPEKSFPMTINPGETGKFPVCFRSVAVRDENYIDTLYFEHFCDVIKIPLDARSDTLFVNAGGRCEVPLEMTITEVPDDYYVLQNYPNPMEESTIITVGVSNQGRLKLDIFNSMGVPVQSVADITVQPGIYRFEIKKENMPQGLYFYDVKINNFRKVRKMLIQ